MLEQGEGNWGAGSELGMRSEFEAVWRHRGTADKQLVRYAQVGGAKIAANNTIFLIVGLYLLGRTKLQLPAVVVWLSKHVPDGKFGLFLL